MVSVLGFDDFHKLNEEEEKGPASQFALAADAIIDTFFAAYGALIPTIGEYKDAIKDLRSLEKENTLAGKGKKMQEIAAKIAGLLDGPYKALAGDVNAIGASLLKTWNTLLQDENVKKEAAKIQDLIESKLDSYIENLLDAAKEKSDSLPKKTDESFPGQEIGGQMLFERVVSEERDQLASTLATYISELKTAIKSQKGVDATRDFRQKCLDVLKQMNTYNAFILGEEFNKLKRFEKKEKIDEVIEAIGKTKKEIQEASSRALVKIGVSERIKKAITELKAKMAEIMAKLQEIQLEEVKDDTKDSEEGGEGEEESDEEVTVDTGSFSDLSVGGDNARKAGKNRENIKSWQVLYNTINPKKKIAEDGIFGRADKKRGQTEDAIEYTANLLGTLLNKPDLSASTKKGTVLTSELQALTKAFVEKILPEMKKKLATVPVEKGEKKDEKKEAKKEDKK